MKAKQFLATLIITLAFFNVSSSQQELDLIMVMMGENRGDGFGKSISAGDFNNDGFSDVVIGAPLYPENEENLGRVYIYFGSKTMIDTADLVLTGETKNNAFGAGVSQAEDVNGDSLNDFIIGAPGYDSNKGKIYVYFGDTDLDTLPNLTIKGGEQEYDYFGAEVSTAGDVNSDGYDDLIVISIKLDGINDIFIYFGGTYVDTTADWVLREVGTIRTEAVTAGDVNGDGYDDVLIRSERMPTRLYFGGAEMDTVADLTFYEAETIGGAGDLNEDGFDDIAIAFHFRSGGPLGTHVFFGSAQMDTTPDISLLRHTGTPVGAIDLSHGDINGDGYQDIIIGAVLSFGTGALYVYLGGPGMDGVPEVVLFGSFFSQGFGSVVSSAGDVNGDGLDDVLVSNLEYLAGTYRGEVFLFSGDSTLGPTAVEGVWLIDESIPREFRLSQNYPNPFNATTVMNYQLPMHNSQLTVTLKIFNILGEEVRSLVSQEQKAGRYGVVWDGRDNQGRQVGSGIYLYRLTAGRFNQVRKTVFLK